MIKSIYAVGCSMTYGDDLPDDSRSKLGWPYLLGQKYNATAFNDGMSAGSNDRNLSHLINNIDNYDKFYIAWTMIHRFTLVDPQNWVEVNFARKLTNRQYRNLDQYSTFGNIILRIGTMKFIDSRPGWSKLLLHNRC